MRTNERSNAELAHSFPSSDSRARHCSPGQGEWKYRVRFSVARRAANEEGITSHPGDGPACDKRSIPGLLPLFVVAHGLVVEHEIPGLPGGCRNACVDARPRSCSLG